MKLDCTFLTDELFLAYQSRSLEGLSPGEVKDHLQDCLACREKYNHLLTLYSTVQGIFTADLLRDKEKERGVFSALLSQFSFSCQDLTEEFLFDYLAGDLPDFEKNQIAGHLQGCSTCQRACEGARESLGEIRSAFALEERDPSRRIPLKIWKKAFPSPYPLFRIAAALLGFLGIGILCYSLFFSPKSSVKRIETPVASQPQKGLENQPGKKKTPGSIQKDLPKTQKITIVHKEDSPGPLKEVRPIPHPEKGPEIKFVKEPEKVSPRKDPLLPKKDLKVAKGSKVLQKSPDSGKKVPETFPKKEPKKMVQVLPKEGTGKNEKVEILSPKEEDKTPVVEKVKILVQKPLLPGDVNGDGKVDISDVMLLSRQLIGSSSKEKSKSEKKKKKTLLVAADFNRDGKVNVVDVMILTKSILKQ